MQLRLKLLILILSVILAITSQAQTRIAVEGGYSINKGIVAGAYVGYQWRMWNLNGGLISHTSNQVASPAIFQLRAGREIPIAKTISINPLIGYGYVLKSTDVKSINKNTLVSGIEIAKRLKKHRAFLYLSASMAGDMKFLTGGLRGLF